MTIIQVGYMTKNNYLQATCRCWLQIFLSRYRAKCVYLRVWYFKVTIEHAIWQKAIVNYNTDQDNGYCARTWKQSLFTVFRVISESM